MSTTVTSTPPAHSGKHDSVPATTPVRGLIRATLRVHRSALWFWALLVALVGGGLLWATGPGLDAAWDDWVRSGCKPLDYCSTGPAYSHYQLPVNLGSAALTLTPALIGAWAGGALIGRELETGTARLAWTQSVTPAHWLAAKLAVPAAAIVSGTVVLTLLNRLVWSREERLRQGVLGRDWFEYTVFTGNGPVATAYALLALAVGVVAGLLIRRSLPALAAGVTGVAVVMGVLRTQRHALWPVETVVSRTPEPRWQGDPVGRGFLSASGDRIPDVECLDDVCDPPHITGYYVDYHPSSHFWPLQLVETGIVLAVTALLVWAAFRLLRRRTGGAV